MTSWGLQLVEIVDRDRLLKDTEIPLELQVSGERDLTDEAVQAVARQALETRPTREDLFDELL